MRIRRIVYALVTVFATSLVLTRSLGSLNFDNGDRSDLFKPALANPSSNYEIFLPFLANHYPLITVFGLEMSQITNSGGLDLVAAANPSWVRRNGVIWSDIEPNVGDRNWSAMAGLETELVNAANNNMPVVLIVRSTPPWAQQVPGSFCGPIQSKYLTNFASFMHDLVARYSVSPYNVKYWEIWNEPDVDPALAAYIGGPSIPFGCWGDSNDPYYGGGYYADMLKAVFPLMKATDPDSQILVGGLLLLCDPRPRASCEQHGYDPRPAKFFEGILRHGGLNDGANYFDGVGFHNYDDYIAGTLGQYARYDWNSSWNTTGPAVIAKARYLKWLLQQYNISGKFVMNTEGAIVCGEFNDPPGGPSCESDPTSPFEVTKAYYVTQLYAATLAEGLRASTWYSVGGWRNSNLLTPQISLQLTPLVRNVEPAAQDSGLVDSAGTPRPAYYAFKFARSELIDAVYLGDISSADVGGVSGVKGYKFSRGDRTVWVLWSLDGAVHSATLAASPRAIFTPLGNDVAKSRLLLVTLMPLYVEW